MRVAVKANHGAYIRGHSGDLRFLKIRTVDNHPSVLAVTRFTAILNPVTPFVIKNDNSNPVDPTANRRDGKHEERRQNHRHQYMVWAASKLGMTRSCTTERWDSATLRKRIRLLSIPALRLSPSGNVLWFACMLDSGAAAVVNRAE